MNARWSNKFPSGKSFQIGHKICGGRGEGRGGKRDGGGGRHAVHGNAVPFFPNSLARRGNLHFLVRYLAAHSRDRTRTGLYLYEFQDPNVTPATRLNRGCSFVSSRLSRDAFRLPLRYFARESFLPPFPSLPLTENRAPVVPPSRVLFRCSQ